MSGTYKFSQGYIHILNDDELQRDVVHRHHDTMVAGHPGESKMLKLLTKNYWWQWMGQYV